jgi:Ca2+-binding EF-hand superfamily protein
MVLPCEDNYLRTNTEERFSDRVVGRFDHLHADIERALADVIESELGLQARLENMKRDMELKHDYTISAAFRTIDRYNDGVVNNNNLRNFLASQGAYLTEHELT